jgi:hypothetical protein
METKKKNMDAKASFFKKKPLIDKFQFSFFYWLFKMNFKIYIYFLVQEKCFVVF